MATPTLRQRIHALHNGDVIEQDEFLKLCREERYTREAFYAIKTRTGESYDDFVAHTVKHAQCHGIAHKWDPDFEYNLGYVPIGAFKLEIFLCETCGAIRIDPVTAIGKVTNRDYILPQGYSAAKGFTRTDWRWLWRKHQLMQRIANLEAGTAKAAHKSNVVSIKGRKAS